MLLVCLAIAGSAFAHDNGIYLTAERVNVEDVNLSWTQVNPNQYVVWRATQPDMSDRVLLVILNQEAFLDLTAMPGEIYFYQIEKINEQDCGFNPDDPGDDGSECHGNN